MIPMINGTLATPKALLEHPKFNDVRSMREIITEKEGIDPELFANFVVNYYLSLMQLLIEAQQAYQLLICL